VTRTPRALGVVALAAAACACVGEQSAVDPAGPQAALILRETWYLVAMAGVVFAAVATAIAIALLRHRRAGARPPADRSASLSIGVALAVTTAVLLLNLVIDMRVEHTLGHVSAEHALTIELTGRQWWWEVEYRNDDPSRSLTTANEIHIPVGKPVLLQLRSADVIHSFWVPKLHGKRDLVPGTQNDLWIQADAPGVFRGECAEFCGHQHAHMALRVVALPPDEFDQWYERELAPAAAPTDELAQAGEQVFLAKACPTCHAVRGTDAGARVAPDLTHLAARRDIGAGALPNMPGALAQWILDPHTVKPGVKMPQNSLSGQELSALLAYLGGLR
jgi:cytochrome c oxidase subunit 2